MIARIGKYSIERELGHGGFGDVFLAFDPDVGQKVAIKHMRVELGSDPEMLKRFQYEIRTTASLRHKNIVTILASGVENGSPYLVMEYLEGQTLKQIIQARIPLTVREKVGIMFGNPETTSGGRALKFYASIRLDVRKLETIKVGQDSIGTRTRVKVVKNKCAPPFRQAEFDITYGHGISKMGSILDVALDQNIVGKSGSWYTYGEQRIGQGRENAKAFLEEHSDVAVEIESKIREALSTVASSNGKAPAAVAVEG